MKKIINIVLSFVMIFSLFSIEIFNVRADSINNSEDYSYIELEDGTIEIASYKGSNTNIIIPSKIEGKNITSIGEEAFRYCEDLQSVVISNGIINIKDWAFSNCNNLTSITIPNSVTNIGENSFYGCMNLISIDISENVTNIGDWAFYGCSNLKEITVDVNNKNYSSYKGALFNKNKTEFIFAPESVTEYIIPDSVINIRDIAFSDCVELIKIVIPNSVKSIGWHTFSNCRSLKTVSIPSSITTIGEGAFYDCSNLTNINIPDSVKDIGAEAFSYCTSLKSITIPKSVTSIGMYAFYNCNDLTVNVYSDSYALKYVKENKIPYNIIDSSISVKSISLNKKTLILKKRKTYILKAIVNPSNATNKKVIWSTSNKNIVAINENGKMTAKNYGQATIIAKTCNGKIAKCIITVPYRSISYKLNGGKNHKSNPLSYYGKKFKLKDPTKKGYVFSGWYSDKKYKKKVTTLSGNSTKTQTLYAKWTKVKVNKAKTPKLTNVKGKKLKITYSATSGAKGYQIQYSTSKKFTKATTKTVKGKSATYTLAKKTYYVRVRAYKTDSSGAKVYGSWSTVKSIKIKK